jgi:hypothetical protein
MEIVWYYFKSTYTGQIYRLNFIPQYGGYEETTKEEYEEYCTKMGLK